MYHGKIPFADYSRLAERFHPGTGTRPRSCGWRSRRAWATSSSRRSTTTASRCTTRGQPLQRRGRDAVASRPHGRPRRECRRQGIRLCFYYSQDLTGSTRTARGTPGLPEGGQGSGPLPAREVFPQLTEILTRYGPLGMIWFDTPLTLSRETAPRSVAWSRGFSRAAWCRDGSGMGWATIVCRATTFSPVRFEGDWETCATLNHTWGTGRTTTMEVRLDLNHDPGGPGEQGANYLLNIGPDADGRVPPASAARLRAIGAGCASTAARPRDLAQPLPQRLRVGTDHDPGPHALFHLFGKPGRYFRLQGRGRG